LIKYLGRKEDNLPLEHTAQHFECRFKAKVTNLNSNSKTQIDKLLKQVWDIINEQNEEQKPSSGPVTRSRSRRVRTSPYPSTHELTAPGSPGESFSQNFDSAGSSVPQIQSLQNCSTQIWIISSDET